MYPLLPRTQIYLQYFYSFQLVQHRITSVLIQLERVTKCINYICIKSSLIGLGDSDWPSLPLLFAHLLPNTIHASSLAAVHGFLSKLLKQQRTWRIPMHTCFVYSILVGEKAGQEQFFLFHHLYLDHSHVWILRQLTIPFLFLSSRYPHSIVASKLGNL